MGAPKADGFTWVSHGTTGLQPQFHLPPILPGPLLVTITVPPRKLLPTPPTSGLGPMHLALLQGFLLLANMSTCLFHSGPKDSSVNQR